MMALVSSGGNTPPWQRGQSGQPNPDSVTRTTPPKITKAKVEIAVARVRPLNHWSDLPGLARSDLGSANAIESRIAAQH